MVIFKISTKKHKTMEKAFTKLQMNLIAHASKGVTAYWEKCEDGTYKLEIKYMFQNKGSNWVLGRELKSVVKKIDPDATIKKL